MKRRSFMQGLLSLPIIGYFPGLKAAVSKPVEPETGVWFSNNDGRTYQKVGNEYSLHVGRDFIEHRLADGSIKQMKRGLVWDLEVHDLIDYDRNRYIDIVKWKAVQEGGHIHEGTGLPGRHVIDGETSYVSLHCGDMPDYEYVGDIIR